MMRIAMPTLVCAIFGLVPSYAQASTAYFSQNTANVSLPNSGSGTPYLVGTPVDAVPEITLPEGVWVIQAKVNPVSFSEAAIQVSCSTYVQPTAGNATIGQPTDTTSTVVGGVGSGAPVTAVITNAGVAKVPKGGAILELKCELVSYIANQSSLPNGVYLTGASWLIATSVAKSVK